MILAVDTYYFENKAKTVCLMFNDWGKEESPTVLTEITEDIEDYVSGAFYKRELPCIMSILKHVDIMKVTAIIVDGFVYLNDSGKKGLGAYVYQELNAQIPVIGVAKRDFATISKSRHEVLRGSSLSPLYVSATGIDLTEAAERIRQMEGDFRIPSLLKYVDQLTKSRE